MRSLTRVAPAGELLARAGGGVRPGRQPRDLLRQGPGRAAGSQLRHSRPARCLGARITQPASQHLLRQVIELSHLVTKL